MNRRTGLYRIPIVILVLGAATALAIWWHEPPRVAARPAEPAASAATDARSPPSTAAAAPSRDEVSPQPPDAAAHASRSEQGDLSKPPARTGRVIVVDPEGREHATESGSITWIAGNPLSPVSTTVERGRFTIAAPAGTKLSVAHAELGGRRAHPEREETVVGESGFIELRVRWIAATRLRVVDAETGADLQDVQVVHVQDAGNEHPGSVGADGVLVDHATSPFGLEPIEGLLGTEWRGALHVRAPGYAWTRFEVDFTIGGEPRVALRRSAELEVSLINYHPDRQDAPKDADAELAKMMEAFTKGAVTQGVPGQLPDEKKQVVREQMRKLLARSIAEQHGRGPAIRVREPAHRELPPLDEVLAHYAAAPDRDLPNGERPSESEIRARYAEVAREGDGAGKVEAEVAPAAEGPTLIAGLLPGKHLVSVEIGWADRDPIVLGRLPVELRTGERTSIALELADPPKAEKPAPLAGTLYLPPAWGPIDPKLSLEILGRPDLEDRFDARVWVSEIESVAGSPGLHRWTAGLVTPGRYAAIVNGFELPGVVDVPPEGREDARLAIGEPADMRVRVLDESGADVAATSVRWNGVSHDLFDGDGPRSAHYDATTRTYGFRAPAGRVEIHVWERGFRFVDEAVALSPGPNEHTIRLEHACGVILSLRDSAGKVAWPGLCHEQLEAVGHPGAEAESVFDEYEHYTSVTTPGRYRVSVPEIDGYEPVPPFEVDVPRGEFVPRSVALERR